MRNKCVKNCKQRQCQKTEFIAHIKAVNHKLKVNESSMYRKINIFINRPLSDEKTLIHHPSVTIAHYFSWMGGLLALWFGLSMIRLYDIFKTQISSRLSFKLLHKLNSVNQRKITEIKIYEIEKNLNRRI